VKCIYPEASSAATSGIFESREHGLVILSNRSPRTSRRVLYTNSYGGHQLWAKIKNGSVPPHHLWGCLELARRGYEVALAEPLPDFYLYRNPLPHDLRLLKPIKNWLGEDGVVYCGHNVLYWIPLLRILRAFRSHVVSNLFAREPLEWSRGHSGIIALTPAGAEQARRLAPHAKVAQLPWGVDLDYFPQIPYNPKYFLSCGITLRDHRTLSMAAARCRSKIRVICPGVPQDISWPANVDVTDGGKGWNIDDKKVGYNELLHDYYGECAASLIILKNDPIEYTAVGFTNLIEAMAMGRPVIVTRTGALPTEIDVEKVGCGLHVPPEDPAALAGAIQTLADDPERASAMGEAGRHLVETHYNIQRYSDGLHTFFESL
jgi:glycosyltransferase involved in cell wall biosynthesis